MVRARYIRELIQREIKQTMKITSVFGPTHQYQLISGGAAPLRLGREQIYFSKKSIPVTFALSIDLIV